MCLRNVAYFEELLLCEIDQEDFSVRNMTVWFIVSDFNRPRPSYLVKNPQNGEVRSNLQNKIGQSPARSTENISSSTVSKASSVPACECYFLPWSEIVHLLWTWKMLVQVHLNFTNLSCGKHEWCHMCLLIGWNLGMTFLCSGNLSFLLKRNIWIKFLLTPYSI